MIKYTDEQRNDVLNYIYENIGKIDEIYYRNGPDDIELEIAVLKPTENRDFFIVATVGFGAYKMNVAEEIPEKDDLCRCELIIALPSDWKIPDNSEEYYWPIACMENIVRMVIIENSWIGPMHTIDFGKPMAESKINYTGAMIIPPNEALSPRLIEYGMYNPELGRINMYYVMPLYEEELNLKIRLGGNALLERIVKIIDNPIPTQRERLSVGLRYKKEHFKRPDEITSLEFQGPNGSLVTDKVLVDGHKVGYCYREKPKGQDFWDSGWRFTAGDESAEEICDKSKISICSLNEVAAIDDEVKILLDSPYGSIYKRDEKGMFQMLEEKDSDFILKNIIVDYGDYEILDDGMVHMDTILSKGIDRNELNGLNHIAAYIRWAMEENLLSDDFYKMNKNILDNLRENGSKTPFREYIYENFDGQLRDTFFNEKGILFTHYCYYNNDFVTCYTRSVDEYAMEVFGMKRYESDEFKNEAYVFLDYDEDYFKGVTRYIREIYISWDNNIHARRQQPIIGEKEKNDLKKFEQDKLYNFSGMVDYLEGLARELSNVGVFSSEEICRDLDFSLNLMFAAINQNSFYIMKWVKGLIGDAEENAKGCGVWYYRFSVLLTKIGELEKAIEYAQKGVNEDSEYPWGWLHLGKLQAHFKEKEKALNSVDIGQSLVSPEEEYEFNILREEILMGATIETMMFHLIDEDFDKEQMEKLSAGTDDVEISYEKDALKYITVDEEGLEERKDLFDRESFYEGDSLVSISNRVENLPCILYISSVNRQYFSKMKKDILKVMSGIMEDYQWLMRRQSNGREYRLECIFMNNYYQSELLYVRDDGLEIIIPFTENEKGFANMPDLEEIDSTIVVKSAEIEKDNVNS